MGLFKSYYTARKSPPRWLVQMPGGKKKEYAMATTTEIIDQEIQEEGCSMVDSQDLCEYLGIEDDGGFVDEDHICEKATEKGLVIETVSSDTWAIYTEESYNG